MRIFLIESKMFNVKGADWRPLDGKAYRCMADAELAMGKLAKKRTALVDYEFRITPYTPEQGARKPSFEREPPHCATCECECGGGE